MFLKLLFAGLGQLAGIQGSFYTEMDDHVPTRLISHLLTRDLADTILRQPYDGEYDLALVESSSWIIGL